MRANLIAGLDIGTTHTCAVIGEIHEDMRRANSHYGHRAMMANVAESTIHHWGFDPRELRVRHRVLWYAADDRDVPPEHGRWLADEWRASAGQASDVKVRVFDGYGHVGGGCFEWDAFLEELMAQCATAAPRLAGILRC